MIPIGWCTSGYTAFKVMTLHTVNIHPFTLQLALQSPLACKELQMLQHGDASNYRGGGGGVHLDFSVSLICFAKIMKKPVALVDVVESRTLL